MVEVDCLNLMRGSMSENRTKGLRHGVRAAGGVAKLALTAAGEVTAWTVYGATLGGRR